MLSGPNPIRADQMTAQERLAEVAALLAAGLLRRRLRTEQASSSPDPVHKREVRVDFSPNQSGRVEEAVRWRKRA